MQDQTDRENTFSLLILLNAQVGRHNSAVKRERMGIKRKEKKMEKEKSRCLLKYGYPQNVLSIRKLRCKT